MAGSRQKGPVSLDALLSANRERFDQLFDRQIAGGQAVPAGTAPTAEPEARQTSGQNGAAVERETAAPSEAPAAPTSPFAGAAARGAETAIRVDVVTLNVVDAALAAVRDEMATVLARSAMSAGLRGGMPDPAMIMDGAGNLVAGSHGSFLAHMLETHRLQLADGDVLLLSDPYSSAGAAGAPDQWLIVAPVVIGHEIEGYTAVLGRMGDVGASDGTARTIFGEGTRIPPVKIVEGGRINRTALQIILANSRTPDRNRVDLMALVAACQAGAAGVVRLCGQFGTETYHRACRGLRERSDRIIRRLIVDQVPEEPQTFEDQIDGDGLGNGPFALRLTVWREADHAYFDWTGSAPQAPGPVNFFLHVGLAKAWIGRYLAREIGPGVLSNDGYYDQIHVTLPGASILSPAYPAAVGRHAHARVRHLEVLAGATDRHVPERLAAAGYGAEPTFTFRGAGVRLTDPVFGGLPARPGQDGQDGRSLAPGRRSARAEDLERDYPVVIERCLAVPGSGGAGRFRGGNGVEKVYRLLAAGSVSIQDDRETSRPWGVAGGRAGKPSAKWIERAGATREALPSKVDRIEVGPGDRIIFRTAGGGGHGDPRERDPARVLKDVVAGHCTIEDAANRYGVILNGTPPAIDRRATAELRDGLMRERADTKLFDRGDPD